MRQNNVPAPLLVWTLLLFTAWPFLYMVLFFVYIAAAMFSIGMGRAGHGLPWMGVFMPLSLLSLLETLLLMAVYALHIIFNPLLTGEKKIGWGIGLVLGSVFAMGAYWYVYFWREMRGEGEGGSGAHSGEHSGERSGEDGTGGDGNRPRSLRAL